MELLNQPIDNHKKIEGLLQIDDKSFKKTKLEFRQALNEPNCLVFNGIHRIVLKLLNVRDAID